MSRYVMLIMGVLMSLSVNGSIYGYVYEVHVLRRWNSERQEYQYVLGLSDFHEKTDSSTQTQVPHIDQLLCHCSNNTETLILTEDLSSRNTSGCCACGRFYVNSRGGLLGGLAEKCEQMGITVNNIEYRYCRVSALGPVLNNITECPHSFPSVKNIRIASLCKEIDIVAQEVESYDDGPILDTIYKADTQEIRSQLHQFNNQQGEDLSVADFLVKATPQADRLAFLKNWLTFDSGLLDLKLAHAVVNAKDKNSIFIIAGGAHVDRVAKILSQVGYEAVHKTKIGYQKEFDLKRCVGCSIINGSFCIRPSPVDLSCLDQFLHKN